MKRKPICIAALLPLVFLLLVSGCRKELEEYYEIPGWLKGNAWQLLESEGNFTLFLEAVEKAGYREMISGKGIITVMAPTDEAFRAWLSGRGYASVEAVPDDELSKVVGFHLVYYAFDKEKLANYRPEGSSNVAATVADAGLYYKFRTKSSAGIETFTDHTVAPGDNNVEKKVYHKERFLPVFSSYLFSTKQIDPAANYRYFFPQTSWDGTDGGFCVANANVGSYSLVTDNGYVYILNKVLEPLETIHRELGSRSDFTLFRQLYDKFADFRRDENLTQDYGKGSDLYLLYHTDLPKIASEWSYNGEGSLPDYADLAQLARLTNNVFAPSDQALTAFFDSFWKGHYASVTDVGYLPVKYLLDNHVVEGDILFPEEIEQGKVTSRYGTVIRFNTADVALKKICANGTLYGLNQLAVPRMFESVTAPLFQDPDYRIFLHMMDKARMIQPLMSDDVDFHLFMPGDRILEDNTTLEGRMLLYQNTNPNKYGEQAMMIEGADQPWVEMRVSDMEGLVKNHIATRLMTAVGNRKVYKTLNSFQYLLVEEDARVWSSHIFNNYPDKPVPFILNSERYNGKAFGLGGETSMALVQDYSLFKEQISKNPPPGFEYFKEMMVAAQFTTSSPPFHFLQGERFIVFVPTNEAIYNNFSKIPLTPSILSRFMMYYFVNVNESSLGDYPFPGTNSGGELVTFRSREGGQGAAYPHRCR